MNLLAIDTTGRSGGIAVTRNGVILEAESWEAPEGFSAIIYPAIEAALKRAGLAPQDIDGYAAAAGPGSFTGIRIGLSVVKSLAEVHGKKVAPVSNLRALACAGTGNHRVAVMDARRGEVYIGMYDNRLRPIANEVVADWEQFLASLGDRPVTFVALERGLFGKGGAAPLSPAENGGKGRVVVASPPLAAAVAVTAQSMFENGEVLAPEAVDANYIRRPDAEEKAFDLLGVKPTKMFLVADKL